MNHSARRRWTPIALAIAALLLLPLSVLLLSWHEVDGTIWSHLWHTQMPRLLSNTLVLVLGVGVGVTLLGVSLAWLTSLCDFPGRRWLDWALMLPFAIPAYVLAFVFIGLLDFSALKDGREVYLCWQHGEGDIAYWHEVEDGYAGRQPIHSF